MTNTIASIVQTLENIFPDLLLLFSDPLLFLDTYFFSASGYNIYNTIVYASLGLIAIALIGFIIQNTNKKGTELWGEEKFVPVRMSTEFFISILPYIFIGSTIRALQDIAVLNKIISPYEFFAARLFVTPGVYLVTIILTLIAGFISIYVSQAFLQDIKYFSDWRITFFTLGLVIEIFLFLPILVLLLTDLNMEYLIGGGLIIVLVLLFSLIFHLIIRVYTNKRNPEFRFDIEEELTVITQMFDAFNTVIAIEFFYYQEKHFLPALLFETPFVSWPFLVIKLIVVLLAIYAIRSLDNQNQERWLLWIVFLLGLATGTRDFLRLITNT